MFLYSYNEQVETKIKNQKKFGALTIMPRKLNP